MTSLEGVCSETLSDGPFYSESISGGTRTISSNGIPDHKVGLFGRVQGAINPNAISAQNETYRITMEPSKSGNLTALLSDNGPSMVLWGIDKRTGSGSGSCGALSS